jgi:HEAT repeat protein
MQAQTPIDRAWTILAAGAKDKSHEKRSTAINALGVITGDERAQSAAEAALKDESEDVRAVAANVLGSMRAKGSAPKLIAVLKDPAAAVVFAAANALYVMGDPAGHEVYYAVLTRQRKSGDALVDSQMKMLKDPKALSKLGFEAGIGFVPFGGVSYKAFKMATGDTVSPVRAAAASKLSNDPDAKSAAALTDAAKDEKWLVRAAVVNAIARRNDASMLSAIIPLMDDQNDLVRFNAAAAVVHLNSPNLSAAKLGGEE